MLGLVGNPNCWFSHEAIQIFVVIFHQELNYCYTPAKSSVLNVSSTAVQWTSYVAIATSLTAPSLRRQNQNHSSLAVMPQQKAKPKI